MGDKVHRSVRVTALGVLFRSSMSGLLRRVSSFASRGWSLGLVAEVRVASPGAVPKKDSVCIRRQA